MSPPYSHETVIRIIGRRSIRAGIAGIFAGAAAACASKPIEVTTPAIIALDTSRMAIRLRKPAPARSFWGAMANLDPDYANAHPTAPDERQFAAALGMIMAGDPDEAELLLDSLSGHAGDSIVRTASHILLTAALQYQDKWKDLADLSATRPVEGPQDSVDRDRAGVERWATAFKGVATRRLELPGNPVVVPLTISVAGTPVIPVRINGKPKLFWLDTGSSMSILGSDVAVECGVEPLVNDTLEVVTTTGRIAARPAVIRRVDIGGISIMNSTAMIVDAGLLEVRVGESRNRTRTTKIDGIIGFDIISRLDVRIDYVRGTVRLSRAVRATADQQPQRNFFWVGTPIVRLIAQGGIPVNLGLDTGAQETYATERMLQKVKVRTFLGERTKVGGFGGLTEFRGRFISNLRLSLRGKTLLLQKLLVFVPATSTFVNLDGALGSDIGRAGIVRIDATNGIFSVEAESIGR